MAIAKVEPLTTARALRGPFDYLLPERLGEVDVGSVLLVPFGRRRVLGVVVEVAESSELAPERLAEPDLRPGGRRHARAGSARPLDGARVLLDPRPGAGARASARRRKGWAQGRARASSSWRRPPRRAARRWRTAPGSAAASAMRSPSWPPGTTRRLERSLAELQAATGAGRQTLNRLEARGLVALRTRERRRRPSVVAVGARSPRPRLSRRPAGGRGEDRRCDRRGAGARAAAARRHRLGQDRGLPRGRRGGALQEPRGDRAGARDRADAADRGPIRGAVLRPRGPAALAAHSGRAPRRVAAPRIRRGADLRRAALGGIRAGRATWGWW